jgi:radical SAM superfamily enzyme YgiQ (UPF0313 family)
MSRHRPTAAHSWKPYREAERPVKGFPVDAPYRLALAYASTYEVGMSSLGFQRVYDLVHGAGEWSCERYFTNGTGMPLSVETETPLSERGCIAFSVSFEEDYVELLRMLDRARIPLRRRDRNPWDPLVVMGGSAAAINPLPMSEFVDVFALGAAENLLGHLLPALAEEHDREEVLARLAAAEGFFVPSRHDAESEDKLRKVELTAEQMAAPGHLPTTVIVTPKTEFADKYLVEMSRGCPEKCRYCWATFGMGKFRWHPTEYILESLDRARAATDQVGFVATAVGDHPEIARILGEAYAMGFRSSVSSIRIPAVRSEVLEPLHASGARSITLAPETGSDRLRFLMNKPITNDFLLDKVRLVFRHGFTQLKLYFIVGLPGETLEDVGAILELAAACRGRMLEETAKTGVAGHVHLGVNVLIPKPYTPWQREPMEAKRSLEHKLSILKKGVARLPNVSMGTTSVRQAVWQTYLSRAGVDAADAIERVARGEPLAWVMRELAHRIHPEVYLPFPRHLRWHFLRMA